MELRNATYIERATDALMGAIGGLEDAMSRLDAVTGNLRLSREETSSRADAPPPEQDFGRAANTLRELTRRIDELSERATRIASEFTGEQYED